ncbi:protein kinase [Streptomyces sp. NPDC050400]|uniref:serine/threonine-protein kinase n=1 Tax=Streptomyces sp. NPDC050400 TaxID=3365610 RepID=UPI0037B6BDAF
MSEAERAGEARQDNSVRQDSSVEDARDERESAGQDPEGRLLAGRYRLGGVLGRGGMGTVWRAKDETLGRTVAVKELRFPSSIDDEEKRRLITRTLREAKAIARIRNNGAVTVFDVVDEDDRPWIVMELVEGKSLAEAIREDGLLEARRAAEVGLAVLDVLRSAHREGILHRDVKPSNVLISEDGRVVLTDFGIAQVEGDPSITSTGMLVGAPSYISPERARGHKPGPAADLWSLGGLLYAAVEGVPPYDKGSAIATLTAVMTEPVDPPKNAGPLESVIYGLLAKDPAQRLDDAGARALLNEVIHAPEPKAVPEPEPVEATKVVPLPPAPPTTSLLKKRTPKAGSAAAAGVAGVAAKGEEAAEKLRGALKSVRKAAAAATASREKDTTAGSPAAGRIPAQPAGPPPRTPSSGRTAGKASITDVVPRRTLVIAAVVALLVVIGTVLALTLNGGDDSGGKGGDKAASAGTTAGGDGQGKNKEQGKGQEKGSGSGKGSGEDENEPDENEPDEDEGGSAAPGQGASPSSDGETPGASAAEKTYKHSQGFRIGLPKGWKYASTSAAGARFTGPNGQKLLVGWTGTPKSDPVADWHSQEQYMRRAQYDRVRIASVDYRGWNTADWEFTYVDGGTKYHSIDRGFVVNGSLGYGLMYTAKDAAWDGAQRKSTWKTFTETFKPKS